MASLGRKREYVHSPAFHADAAQSASTTHFTPGGATSDDDRAKSPPQTIVKSRLHSSGLALALECNGLTTIDLPIFAD